VLARRAAAAADQTRRPAVLVPVRRGRSERSPRRPDWARMRLTSRPASRARAGRAPAVVGLVVRAARQASSLVGRPGAGHRRATRVPRAVRVLVVVGRGRLRRVRGPGSAPAEVVRGLLGDGVAVSERKARWV
ncbi:MAG: hypothetical protein LC790_07850, partial [Actinobacteria bacterium]|nr:hypothetical protein [Actinomycetota bacterium]